MSTDRGSALGLVRQWMRTREPALLSDAIGALRHEVAAAAARGLPDRESEHILAGLLMSRAEDRGTIEDLDEAVRVMRAAAGARADDHVSLAWFARTLFARFQRTGGQGDLIEAIDAADRAVAATPAGDPALPKTAHELLQLSWIPLDRAGDIRPLTAAITTAGEAIGLVPDGDPGKLRLALSIANALWHRYNHAGDMADVEQVIRLGRGAVRLRSEDPMEQVHLLSRLGEALQARFTRHGDPADLDEAIFAGRRAMDGVPAGRPRPARLLFDLGTALRTRFKRAGRPDDLLEAVGLLQRAVEGTAPGDKNEYVYRAAFVAVLGERTAQAGDEAAREAEIAGNRQVVAGLSAGDPNGEVFQANLGRLLFARFERLGDAADLEASVETLRQAVAVADGTGDLFGNDQTRVHLGMALIAVFRRTGDITALDEALGIGHAIALASVRGDDPGPPKASFVFKPDDPRQSRMDPVDGPDSRATLTLVLADALTTRYEQTGDLADLDDAVVLATTALGLLADTDVTRRMRATYQLAAIHSLRHLRHRDGADLDRAVELSESAITMLRLDDPNRSTALSNLVVLLVRRFAITRSTADISRAVQAAEEALEAASGGTPAHRARALTTLAHALLGRYDGLGAADDLARAVDLARAAAERGSEDEAEGVERLYVLMVALRARHDRSKDAADLAEAVELARRVLRVEPSSPSRRFECVHDCTSWAARSGAWAQAAELYAACVELMPRMASADRHPDTRQYWLSRCAQLTQRAAASALNAGDPQAAAVMLERGRGVLLSHTLDLRESLADLRAYDADLADRFEQLRRRLDDAPLLGTGVVPRLYAPDPGQAAENGLGLQRRRLLQEFDEVLAEIRSRPGFDQYLRPAQWADLIAQAGPGPVVVPNISEYRSDALIIDGAGVRVVELPHATPEALQYAAGSMYSALARSGTAWRERDRDAQMRAQSEIGAVLAWLWDAITEPVLRALDITGPPAPGSGSWPRVWWVPTGLLNLLPLHAAQRGDQSALDRVICSYTPTFRALRVARGRPSARRPPRILAVSMPDTPGAPPLPFAGQEAVALAGRVGGIVTLHGPRATRERVRAELPEHTWAHFACHGLSDPVDPVGGRLLLHDHQARPFGIGEIAGLHLENAELAYLSACETARAADGLADEAVHFGSAFQLAGYRHVVATLWAIRDDVGAELADRFYGHLLDDRADPAAALHGACRRLRERFGSFPALWASHIHIGP
ncbi:CHAT domain-containing protein [Streptomyces sp. NPDC127110]|uniref:CHAT domain-containing protein n=1 Tax=Streptomyces sp. NPDC127110 TaxID=3345362 RepID=UPI003641C2FA